MSVLQVAPDGSQVLDLDAARAARAEARAAAGTPSQYLKISAGYVELAPEIDVLAAEDFSRGEITVGLAKILADPTDIAAIVEVGLTKRDLEQIVGFITGTTLGE